MPDRSVPDIPGTRCLPDVEAYLKQQVAMILRTRPNHFPGSQPVSFVREHLTNNLLNKDYLVCEKSDGLRCLLFVLVNPETNEEAEENTIDFKIGLEFPTFIDEDLPKHDPNREYTNYDVKPKFKLYVWKGGDDPFKNETVEENIKRNGGEYRNTFYNYEAWNDLEVSDEQWERMKNSGESFNGRIGECRQTANGKWELLRFRDDKSNGNHINVVLKILKSIEDSVTKEEIVEMEPQIKARWEERDAMKRKAQQQQQHFVQKAGHSNQPHAQPQHHHQQHQPHKQQPPAHLVPEKRRAEEDHLNNAPYKKADSKPDVQKDVNTRSNDDNDDDEDEFYQSDGFET
ncbi:mRNA-capping enzyme subunit alpha [Pichia kudriavzevii]|uniref:mRNA guanylyltransferase n=1 Tax=Pichia kudriavzevii TaxID=4909 RepID=A0A1V2LQ33_PICKU|nr:mRNA-capping enzyme subunit alpha [Pichia kudriavzevii]